MKNVFDKLSPTLQLILAQCTAIGLDLTALLAGGVEGLSQRFSQISSEFKSAGLDLKAILNGDYASLKKTGDLSALVEEGTKLLQSQLTAAQNQVTAHAATITAYTTAIAAIGATVKASDEKVGITAADIEAALNARSSIKAADQLAKHGLAAPLPVTPAGDSLAAAPAKPESKLFGRDRYRADFDRQIAAMRSAKPAV